MAQQRLGSVLIKTGGIIAISVSIALFVWLVVRPEASINPLNLATMSMASLAGAMSMVGTHRKLALVFANLLMVIAVAPTIFGWVWLLYSPAVLLLFLGSLVKARLGFRLGKVLTGLTRRDL